MRKSLLVVIALGACHKVDNGSPDASPSHDSSPGDGSSITGVAHVLHGASTSVAFRGVPAIAAAAADGQWWVSPDKVRVTIDVIGFAGVGGNGTGAQLTGCMVEYDRATPALSNLLDCPFTLPQPVTAIDISLQLNATFEFLISDAANGIFTDSTKPGHLSKSAPAGGADYVSITSPNGLGTADGPLTEPVEIMPDGTISLALVMDAIQTLVVDVSGGTPTLAAGNRQPVVLFPTFDTPGRAAFYSTAATAGSLLVPPGYSFARVYYGPGAGSQPASLFATNVGPNNRFSEAAYPTDPADSPVATSGARTGGWLGRDATGTMCWTLPADKAYATYAGYLTMPEVSTLGATATISSQTTATPTPPTSGSTYASGCPAIVADATTSYTLVAQ